MNTKIETAITVNKDRRRTRTKDGYKVVYLEDGQPFELLITNPTEETVAAQISFQGEKQQKELVIYPGQRIYLDRFIEENRTLQFFTYDVPEDNEKYTNKNGLIEIEFFKKKRNQAPSQYYYYTDSIPTYRQSPRVWCEVSHDMPPKLSDGGLGYTDKKSWKEKIRSNVKINLDFDTHVGDTSTESTDTRSYSTETTDSSTFETGRIGKGSSSSDTRFKNVDMLFESTPFEKHVYKLTPASKSNSGAVRYCTDCGLKREKNFNFCPKCGVKFT